MICSDGGVKEYTQKKDNTFRGSSPVKPKDKKFIELQALKKELREIKLERDILKKAVHIFSKSDGTNIDLSSCIKTYFLSRRCAKFLR